MMIHRMYWVALVALLALPAGAQGQRLLETDGIELRGTARVVTYGAAVCNVLEEKYTEQEYEKLKANHGQPLNVWQLDFSVYNGSGKWLDHLIARYGIESKWPPCTNWSGDGPGGGPSGTYSGPVEWASSIGHIQKSGRNVVAPGATLTATTFIIAFHEEQPRFANWSVDFTFGESVTAGGAETEAPAASRAASAAAQQPAAATAEQESLFWQSIMNSTAAADFEAYLRQFPNGIFRVLAQNRLAALGAPGSDLPAPNRFPAEADSQADHVETPQPICEDGRKWDDPPCWVELTSHPSCYVWVRHHSVAVSSMGWTGSCANRRAEGSGTLEWIPSNEFTYQRRATGLLRGGKRTGRWTYHSFANWVSEVPYVDGKKHGTEIDRGSSYGTVVTTPWVNSKRHGTRVERDGDGNVVQRVEYVNGVKQ